MSIFVSCKLGTLCWLMACGFKYKAIEYNFVSDMKSISEKIVEQKYFILYSILISTQNYILELQMEQCPEF